MFHLVTMQYLDITHDHITDLKSDSVPLKEEISMRTKLESVKKERDLLGKEIDELRVS